MGVEVWRKWDPSGKGNSGGELGPPPSVPSPRGPQGGWASVGWAGTLCALARTVPTVWHAVCISRLRAAGGGMLCAVSAWGAPFGLARLSGRPSGREYRANVKCVTIYAPTAQLVTHPRKYAEDLT
jgi:hypothetical protein